MDQKSMRKLDVNKEAENIGRFWKRLLAGLVDILLSLPVLFLLPLVTRHVYFFAVYQIIVVLYFLFLRILFVAKFKGTPGKILLNLKIVKQDNSDISLKEAFLRYIIIISWSVFSAALSIGIFYSDPYYSNIKLAGKLFVAINDAQPGIHHLLLNLVGLWYLADIIVFIANKKNRALHDLIAGTIVVNK